MLIFTELISCMIKNSTICRVFVHSWGYGTVIYFFLTTFYYLPGFDIVRRRIIMTGDKV
ncbi:hypothetical protein XBJ2_1870012 [Xenorhabdus bovienii str. Jollieti]|uniref:Uncharacterized protein n=1 Tax=Xenorhabdus bovienii (strain SS-2004) TaxID=406818 RepID=D3V594_XENBS|nr:hypothetical protein XBJ1_3705 [Xenorhabdus bovienii SS-2004]CDH28603.1 hypothetical protein XBJ2_1870012 [Xenorhabdus bovienii str. Jollieti]